MDSSPAAAKTIRLLNALARRVEPQPAATLARELDLPRTTTYRLLATLEQFGYVIHFHETGRFALGPGAYELAWGYQRQEPLRRIALPIVEKLADRTGKAVHFALLSGKNVVYVIEQRGVDTPSLITEVGVRLPAELTASGRAMLAQLNEQQVAALYPSAQVLVTDEGAPGSLAELRAILDETRERGWAEEVDAVTSGWSLATALTDQSGYPLAAIAVTFATQTTSDADRDELVQALKRAATSVGYRADSRS